MSKETPGEKIEDLIKGMRKESDEKLNSVKEELIVEAKHKAEQARAALKGSKYELSETFFEPTGATVQVNPSVTAFAAWKGEGIRRPYATSLITPETVKLYHHESGIISFLENKRKELRLVTRVPIEIVRLLDTERLSKEFPSIETGLYLEKEGVKTNEIEVYFDGDIEFVRKMPWRFGNKNAKDLEPWEKGLTNYKDFTKRTISETYSAIKSISNNFKGEAKKRNSMEVFDFTRLGAVHPRYSFEGAVVSGSLDGKTQILSRVLQDDAEKEDGVNYEVLVQVPVVRNIGYQVLAKNLAVITGSPFPQFEADSPEFLQYVSGKWYGGWGHDDVHAVGDVVYDRHAASKDDYQQSKDVVNKIGKEFLDKKLEHEFDF